MQTLKMFLRSTAGKVVISAVLLGIGFLGGMEYKANQVRSVLNEAFSGFGSSDQEDAVPTKQDIASNDLNKKVTMSVEKKSFSTKDYQDSIELTFKFTNTTGKDIEGVQGEINFMDLFGNPIKQVQISYDEGIKAGETKLYSGGVDYNQFIDEDIALRGTELAKLKYEWDVDTIIYVDGTKETK